jgi:thymidine kinase
LFSLDALENVSEKVKRSLRVLRSFVTGLKAKLGDLELELGVDPEKGTADSGDLEADLSELFVAVAEAAADRGKAVAICIDELQYLSQAELSALIMALHRVAQRALPLVLVAGLSQMFAGGQVRDGKAIGLSDVDGAKGGRRKVPQSRPQEH